MPTGGKHNSIHITKSKLQTPHKQGAEVNSIPHLPTNPTHQSNLHHMGKKMKLIPFLSKTDPTSPSPSPSPSPPAWQWPSCGNIKTTSFRAPSDDIFKMANSTFATDPPDICFTSSSSLAESSEEEQPSSAGDAVETVIRGLRSSERLFYEPGETTSSILEVGTNKSIKSSCSTCDDVVPYKESEVVSMDSKDPYADFRRSMEEMMEAHRLKDWAGLEELLSWYLKVNGKANHGYIVGAFIDLLVGLSFAEFVGGETSSSSASSSFTISHSSLPSSPLSLPSSMSIPTPCSSHPLDQGDDDINVT